MSFTEDETCLDDILRDIDIDSPFYDLELIEIPKYNYDPKKNSKITLQ